MIPHARRLALPALALGLALQVPAALGNDLQTARPGAVASFWTVSAGDDAFGWRDFDAEFGTLLWMPAADDDRPFLPMVWTCMGDRVEVAFPRTHDEPDREPWQMFLRLGGQYFVSDMTVHDHGLTADYPIASGLLTELQERRELVIAPDRDEQVVLPTQSGDLDARDRFVASCLAEFE